MRASVVEIFVFVAATLGLFDIARFVETGEPIDAILAAIWLPLAAYAAYRGWRAHTRTR